MCSTIPNTTPLIRRISNRHRGMSEADTRRLIQAFRLCRITYSIPYPYLAPMETEQLNRIIRTAYETDLHLPNSMPTQKLLLLGVHSTLGELVEAHLLSQCQRLSRTETSQILLRRLALPRLGSLLVLLLAITSLSSLFKKHEPGE